MKQMMQSKWEKKKLFGKMTDGPSNNTIDGRVN